MDDYGDVDESHTMRSIGRLTNIQINELVHNEQKFNNTLKQLNQNAISKIHQQKPVEALLLLAEGQKILQYGANCGKAIDRNVINCILHNQACCYQKMWELQKCCNYIQALIYNINLHLDIKCTSNVGSEDRVVTSTSLASCGSESYKGKPISQRIILARHYLQYCALNSQMKKHVQACHHSLKSINIFKEIFKELSELSKNLDMDQSSNNTEQLSEDLIARTKIIQGLAAYPEQVSYKKRDLYFNTAKYCLEKWTAKKSEMGNLQIRTSLRNFSIGTVMQLKPQSLKQNKDHTLSYDCLSQSLQQQKNKKDLLKAQTMLKLINNILMLCLAYFSAATELRLISSDNYRFMDQNKKNCKQYQQSQMYHLISIIILLIYVPYDMPLIRHIVNSYSSQYGSDIASQAEVLPEETHLIVEQFDAYNYSGYYAKKFQLHIDKQENQKKQYQQKILSKTKINRNSQSNSRDKLKSQAQFRPSKRTSFKLKKQKPPQKSKTKSKSKQKSKSKSKSKSHSKSKSKTNFNKLQEKTISQISKGRSSQNKGKIYSNEKKKPFAQQNQVKGLIKCKSSPKKVSLKNEINTRKLKFVRINPITQQSKGEYYNFEKNQVSHKRLKLNIQSPKQKQPQPQKNIKKQRITKQVKQKTSREK